MMNERKSYTAQEMREMEAIVASGDVGSMTRKRVALMLKQAAEMCECLNEAIREKCPFTRMSCKHGEPCEYVCGTDKWRKALEGAEDESK